MNLEQSIFKKQTGWITRKRTDEFKSESANLVLAFGTKEVILTNNIFEQLKELYPNADIVTSSTAGEIIGVNVEDDSVVATAIQFCKTDIRCHQVNIKDFDNSESVGKIISDTLDDETLRHILVFSDGQLVNGSALVNGLNKYVRDGVIVSGGLAGNRPNFGTTVVGLNDDIGKGNIVAIGFYGDDLHISCGSKGGWDEFGPFRTVTKASGNVLYELDGKSALDLYKRYLGPQAENLPYSALLFPLSMKVGQGEDATSVVRTTHNIDEEENSLILSGEVEEGATVRMMKGNFDRLIEGAAQAARDSQAKNGHTPPELVLLVSCAGRKLVLDQRIEEELEAVEEVFGEDSFYTGFYSYSELSPSKPGGQCDLHNQTMTLTTYTEL